MRKILIITLLFAFVLTSCVSKKQYAELEAKQKKTQDLLNTATVKLNACETDRATLQAKLDALRERLDDLKKTNKALIESSKDLTTVQANKLIEILKKINTADKLKEEEAKKETEENLFNEENFEDDEIPF